MASFTPNNPTEEKKADLQRIFYTVTTLNQEVLFDAYKEMDAFFTKPQGVSYIETYKTSYFEWYVYAGWTLLQWLPNDAVLRAGAYQVPDAIRLGFRVDQVLLTYMSTQVIPDDLSVFYKDLKKNISESSAIVGKENNEPVSLAKIYAELKKINDNFDALKYSEFKTRVIAMLQPTLPTHDYAYIPMDKMIMNLMDLLNFLQATNEETILIAVDAHTKPNFYERLERGDFKTVSKEEIYDAIKAKLGPPVKLLPEKFQETKEFLLQQFPQDASGQFENIEAVMDILDNTATVMGDERLRELYMFNENTAQFEWNQELLNQQPA